MGYQTNTDTVKGYIVKDGDMRPVNVTLNYTKAFKDESVKLTADGVSITVLAQDIKKVMSIK